MISQKRIGFIAAALLAAMLLAACAPAASVPTSVPPAATAAPKVEVKPSPTTAAAPAAKPTAAAPAAATTPVVVKLKVGTSGFSSDAGVFIGIEKGYFKEQGIDVGWELVQPQDTFGLLATGALDVGGTNADIVVFNAIQRGINIKLVADKSSNLPGTKFVSLVVRKDLADQIKTIADLKGRNIGILGENSQIDYALDLWLKKANLTLADIKMVFLPNPADHIPALSTKGIDVSYMVEPFITIAAAQSIGVPWLWLSELDPGNQGAVLVFGERLTKDVDAGRRFMVAYVKGLRDYNDAFFKGKNKAEIVQILIKYTALKDPALYDKVGMPGLHPDGKINIANVGVFQDFLIRKGALKERVDLNKVIDMQFADYAVQQLGPYK